MTNLRKEEKEFTDLLLEISLSYLLMISTCQRKKSMELNLLLNFLDSGWTTKDGMIEKAKRNLLTLCKI